MCAFRRSNPSSNEFFKGRHRQEHWYRDNSVYFITARCVDRYPAFASEEAKRIFWDRADRMSGRQNLREIARIEPEDFYIYNFPGSMEIAALFRPHVKYQDGIVSEFNFPTNTFVCDESANLVFFIGKEPNLRWQAFADCLFGLVREV